MPLLPRGALQGIPLPRALPEGLGNGLANMSPAAIQEAMKDPKMQVNSIFGLVYSVKPCNDAHCRSIINLSLRYRVQEMMKKAMANPEFVKQMQAAMANPEVIQQMQAMQVCEWLQY